MGKSPLARIPAKDYSRLFGPDAPLSPLDRQIAEMSCRDCSVVEISLAANCSPATVVRRRHMIAKRFLSDL